MNHIKATYTKALAILFSFAMLMAGLRAPVLAESVSFDSADAEDAFLVPEGAESEISDDDIGIETGKEIPDISDAVSLAEESEPGLDEAVDFSDQELPDEPESTAPETQSPDEGAALAETPDGEAIPEETPEAPGDPTEEPRPESSAEDDGTGETAYAAVPPETQQDESLTDVEPEAEPGEDGNPIRAAMESGGFAYLRTIAETKAYSTADMQEYVFTLFPGAVVLATAYIERDGGNILEVWFYTADYLFMTAYVAEQDMDSIPLSAGEVDSLAASAACGLVFTGEEQRILFIADGEAPGAEPVETGTEPSLAETEPSVSDEGAGQTPDAVEAETAVQPGGFVLVSQQTRAFLGMDDTASDEDLGNLFLGYFVNDAGVQIESIETDMFGRSWYKVRYMYGADDADGSLIWTAYGVAYVLASETRKTQDQDFTATDYAFYMPEVNLLSARISEYDLKQAYGGVGSFWAGQTNMYASSGHDSEYKQIAKLDGYGTIYATPHYLDGNSVYCLEHTMNSPAVRDHASGPYQIVDLAGYASTPGYSGVIFSDRTMHAIAWVLRHTYPFMVLDRSDSDNAVWSRVAGQFAIREVIKQMEGAQYVRDYWRMDEFYRASGQAPAEYLEYARWLAAGGIAHGQITGDISLSNQSVSVANGTCTGTVTLTTDADRIRISRSAGTITGNTGGEDSSYYYLNSGDTITVSSLGSGFSFTAESISSEEEEAAFLVGVPDADIQKILIPQYGAPYPMKSVSIEFEAPRGALSVTKTDASSGAPLPGAVFELLNGSGTVVGEQTTGADGMARFADLTPGTYTVREKSAPEGYLAAVPDTQSVTVASGATASATFANDRIQGKIRIVKTDALTGAPLSGAGFTVTRLSAPASTNGAGVGISFTLNTDANGEADTGWLAWGRYRVEETGVPDGFIDNHFSVEIDAYENGKTYTVNVPNEPMTGFISITKTDRMDGQPIAGVQFDVYENDEYGSALACTMITDENGVALSEPLRKGKYIVKEHANPTGYVSELATLGAEIRPDETTYLRVTNQPIQGRLRIIKTDELTGAALSGAEFTITRISGLPSHNGRGDGEVVAILTTDEHGVAESPLLTYGTYRVEETKVPAHYVDNSFSTEVTIDVDNLSTYEIGVHNEPAKGWIRLTKADRLNGNPIAGVQFDVYENDEYGSALVCSIVTDADGVATTPPLRKGRYTIREHGATAGYVYEELTLDATIHSDETTELTATNQPVQVRLKLYKRDADEYVGDPAAAPAVRGDGILTGAVFRILAGEDITDRQGQLLHSKGDVVVDSVTTAGEEASVTTAPLWPGLYEITELTPPAGYQSASSSIFVDARDAAKQSAEAVVTYDGVVTNEILYGAFAIVKLLGSASGDPAPDRVEQPEPGAEFDVFLKSAGSYENAREFERDHIVTDKNGYAMTKALPYGIYTLRQTKGKNGYEIKGPIDVRITGTENLVNPPIVTLSDQPIRYRLRFIKTDAETGKTITLAHASFKLKDDAGNYITQKVYYPTEREIDTFTTDETGSVTLPETVTWGLYFVEEVQAPEGYLIRDEDFAVFVGNSGDKPGETYQLDIEIPNEPVKGCILVKKKGVLLTGFDVSTDAYGNEVHTPVYEEGYLSGAVFELRAAEDITGRDGTVWYEQGALVDTITTTASGTDTSVELPLGQYELVEVAAPEGYIVDSTPLPVQLTYADDRTALVEIHAATYNDYLPVEISLWKEMEEIQTASIKDGIVQVLTTAPGEGFVFGLFSAEDIRADGVTLMADTLVATGATDRNGKLTFSGHYPHGAYTIRELSGPDGWRISMEPIAVSLTAEQKARDEDVIRVLLTTPVHNALIHGKVTLTKTDITGEQTLPGAVIEVYDEQGNVIYRDTTDENGQIAEIPVAPGTYTFREILAPEGYALSEAVLSFEVNEDGTVNGDTVIQDDYTRFSVDKYDENRKPMAGVEFSLLAEDGSVFTTVRTDKNGTATFEKIPFGHYRIVESKPLAGYLPAEIDVELTVDGTFVNPADPVAAVINVPNEVIIQKVDQNGKALPGAKIGLFDEFGDCFASAVSDENGQVRFTKVPYGRYVIRELAAPEGYLLSKQEIPLTVDAGLGSDGKPVATMVNRQKRVRFIKVDTSGQFLPGVAFSLINAVTGEIVETAVSDERGEFVFTKFDYGDWIVRETEAPEGFSRMEDILLHVDESWMEPEPITCVNIPSTYLFLKTDNHKNPLAGVTFAVEDADGQVVQEVVSDEKGVVTVCDLAPGTYIIRELEALEGYARTDDTIEVVIDENYIVPTRLKRLVNYPSIATGVEIAPNALTWAGIGLNGFAGLLLAWGLRGRRPRRKRGK